MTINLASPAGSQTKRNVRNVKWALGASTLIAFIAQIVQGSSPALKPWALPLAALACILLSIGMWIDFVNHGDTHSGATKKSLLLGGWGVLICGTLFVYNRTHPEAAQPPVVLEKPDYIEGTKYSHEMLAKEFPFGHIVFARHGEIWTHEVPPGDRIEYSIDWKTIVIAPDVGRKSVSWTIPSFDFKNDKVTGHDQSGQETVPMWVGETFRLRLGLSISDQKDPPNWEPSAHVKTLSDDQRMPVFVLGFKIRDGPPPPRLN